MTLLSVRSGASAVCWCWHHTWHRFCVRSSQVHGDTTTLFQVARGLRRCTETPSSCMMRTVHQAGTLHSVLDLAIPLAELNSDIKKDVMEAVTSRMTAICTCTGSRNLEPSWPVVVKAAHTLTTTIGCVEKFAVCISCTECGPVLASLGCDVSSALTWPQRQSEDVKRSCCLIVVNWKIRPQPFLSSPSCSLLQNAACEKMSNLEARNMAERTLKT